MIQIVWEFKVVAGREREFEAQYGEAGCWVHLFEEAPGYCGTVLLRGEVGKYLTIDTWDSPQSFEHFKGAHLREYERLDKLCESLTDSERLIGVFEAV